jgi:endonuclease YncB( thermonuclease family)
MLMVGSGFLIVVGALASALVTSSPASSAELTGRASVIDGDTIEIAGRLLSFHGVDAPERSQSCLDAKGKQYPCGEVSAHRLKLFLRESSPTHCHISLGPAPARLTVVRCFRHDGTNVSSWLVSQGLALDWPKYSKGKFASEEGSARAERRGLWQGQFTQPSRYRETRRCSNCY